MCETANEQILQFEAIIQRRLDLGQTIEQFCQTEGCSKYSYSRMVAKVRLADPSFITSCNTCRTPASAGKFVELVPRRSNAACRGLAEADRTETRLPAAEIQVGSITVNLFTNADAQFMRQLLEAVQDA